ncbi:MAG: hypothetical protein IPN71_20775 [Fibrobacteres bacterium]|nr:hypothetical protein [Fibrobacterota bacterium]
MNLTNLSRAWLPALAACTALLGCQQRVIDPGREAGGSDEIDTRMAMDAKGRPLAGARIALVSAGDSTGKLAALSSTGSNGQYPSFNVPDGQYSATLRDAQDSLGKFLDTLQITGGKAKVGRDTLLALGKIRGVVRLVGGETPATVIMSLYGTDIAANVRKDGSFEIDLVPGGLFTLMGSTSLDGYGTLLRRLQLRDGQDLVIPDTLSLPVTGLLAPANIWVESDTATGDVRVRWNKVDHPNRMGYVLEKVENGVVTQSQFLTDTVWKDSLRGYWEGLPLLGPWPSREAVYRVSTRPLSGKVDSRSVAQSFVAKAPEWTKRVDSVKVTMTTDSVTGVTTLKWNSPKHPDVVGYRATRRVDGAEDCGGSLSSPEWADRNCPVPTMRVIDSGWSYLTHKWIHVMEHNSVGLEYLVFAERRDGSFSGLAELQRRDTIAPLVQWRDSVVDLPGESPNFNTIGDWLAIRDSRGKMLISKDGTTWDSLPTIDYDRYAGVGDSFWVARKVDTSTWMLISRVGQGSWSSKTIQSPSGACSGDYNMSLFALYSDSGSPVFDCNWSRELWKWNGTELEPFSGFPQRNNYWIYDFQFMQNGNTVISLGASGSHRIVYARGTGEANFSVIGEINSSSLSSFTYSFKGVLGSNEPVFSKADQKEIVWMRKTGELRKLNVPNELGAVQSMIVWNNELWLLASDGHLWKGRLNLTR